MNVIGDLAGVAPIPSRSRTEDAAPGQGAHKGGNGSLAPAA